MQLYLIVILICSFLMTNNVQNDFLCLFTICTFSSMKCPFRSFPYFYIGLFILLLLNFKGNLYILDQVFRDICGLNSISPSLLLLFQSLYSVFHRAEVFHFNEVQEMCHFFLSWVMLVLYLKICCQST